MYILLVLLYIYIYTSTSNIFINNYEQFIFICASLTRTCDGTTKKCLLPAGAPAALGTSPSFITLNRERIRENDD